MFCLGAGPALAQASDRVPAIPVIAYHQIRDWRPADSKSDKVYIMPPAAFSDQIRMLHDNGYHTISPDELVAYLERRAELPAHPIMITFDDGTGPQYATALPTLEQYGFKGVFFVMTVVLGHEGYFTRDEVRDITKRGHFVGCHTWDHHMVTRYRGKDWGLQIVKPKAELESITGKAIRYFAYPYGLWNDTAVQRLKSAGYTAAFQLWGKPSAQNPLFAIRRIIADGNWNAHQLLAAIRRDF